MDWDQFIIVGQAYLGTTEPTRPVTANEFRLIGNYPNPFNPTARIVFNLPADLRVTLKVYNTLGQQVAILANNRMLASVRHVLTFNGSVCRGVIFLHSGGRNLFGRSKMALMK